jgi:sugar phosphate isomerase/epimerase
VIVQLREESRFVLKMVGSLGALVRMVQEVNKENVEITCDFGHAFLTKEVK